MRINNERVEVPYLTYMVAYDSHWCEACNCPCQDKQHLCKDKHIRNVWWWLYGDGYDRPGRYTHEQAPWASIEENPAYKWEYSPKGKGKGKANKGNGRGNGRGRGQWDQAARAAQQALPAPPAPPAPPPGVEQEQEEDGEDEDGVGFPHQVMRMDSGDESEDEVVGRETIQDIVSSLKSHFETHFDAFEAHVTELKQKINEISEANVAELIRLKQKMYETIMESSGTNMTELIRLKQKINEISEKVTNIEEVAIPRGRLLGLSRSTGSIIAPYNPNSQH